MSGSGQQQPAVLHFCEALIYRPASMRERSTALRRETREGWGTQLTVMRSASACLGQLLFSNLEPLRCLEPMETGSGGAAGVEATSVAFGLALHPATAPEHQRPVNPLRQSAAAELHLERFLATQTPLARTARPSCGGWPPRCRSDGSSCPAAAAAVQINWTEPASLGCQGLSDQCLTSMSCLPPPRPCLWSPAERDTRSSINR